MIQRVVYLQIGSVSLIFLWRPLKAFFFYWFLIAIKCLGTNFHESFTKSTFPKIPVSFSFQFLFPFIRNQQKNLCKLTNQIYFLQLEIFENKKVLTHFLSIQQIGLFFIENKTPLEIPKQKKPSKNKQSMTSSAMMVEWFASIGISNLITSEDLLSGNTLHVLLKKIVPSYKNDFVTPNTAANKATNWSNLIKSLQKINITVTNDQKNNIFHGSQHPVYDIIAKVKNYVDENLKEPEVDINKIDHRSDPKNSKSLLELFILVIIKNFGLNAKESVALLSNDSKYLAHILAKGFKDQSKPVLNLLADFQILLPKIKEFCINKENEVFFMKSVKPGLISKFRDVSQLALQILQEFSLQSGNPYEAFKVHLLPTMVLQYRRHSSLLYEITRTILKLSKYTKPLLSILISNMNQKQLLSFTHEILYISQENGQLKSFYSMSKIDQIVIMAIDGLNDSNLFSISLVLLMNMIETNIQVVGGDLKNLNNMMNNLQHLTISKSQHVINYINGMFTLLDIFANKRHSLSSQLLKLCIEKYKTTLNDDESTLYANNFLYIIDRFPSIPTSVIAEAVVDRYESYKEVVTDIDVRLLVRVVFGYDRYAVAVGLQEQRDQGQQSINLKIPDEKTAVKIYNALSKMFFENIHNAVQIADAIVYIFVSHISSQQIFDLIAKLLKVSLAVHYANLRKLNIAKPTVNGQLGTFDALAKRKSLDIEYLIKELLSLQNQHFNNFAEPLICYSYIQSTNKNRLESEGLFNLLKILGNPKLLIKKYQDEVKILHDQRRSKKKTVPLQTEQKEQQKVHTASTDQLIKKRLLTGQNYSMFMSRVEKITPDAKIGLLKAQKGFQEKKKKIQLQEMKRIEEEQKKQELQKKHTLKVLQKGIRVDAKIDALYQYMYEFNSKENQINKDNCYDLSNLHIFNPNEEQDNDLQGLKYLMKKYNKVLKLFYSNYGGKLRPSSITLFDQLAQKQSLMTVANVWKLFKDFQLDAFLTIREAQYLVQKLNCQKKKFYNDSNLLDFQIFEDFIIQASLTMFSRPPKDLSKHSISEMVEETFYQFKMLAAQNKIDIRFFDEDLNSLENDENIASLNKQLRNNPDYILPEGYKKVVEKKVEFFHTIALDSLNESYTDVMNILDEIVFQKIGLHILEPFSQITTNTYAKSLLSKKKQQNTDDMKEKYFTLNVKKELFNYSGQDRTISRQVAFCLSEIVEAVELGRKTIFNIKYSAKQLQEQKRRVEQEMRKKREKRDQQLKKIMQKLKSEKQQKQKQKMQFKMEEQKKMQQEKRKKQKYEHQLKKKVQEYREKRQQTLKKEQQWKQKEKKKQLQLFEKKRQQLSKAAKQIQEKKQKEKKQTQQKQRKQKQLLKEKSKKNLKLRSSPFPTKKKVQEKKSVQGEKSPAVQNKNIPSISNRDNRV